MTKPTLEQKKAYFNKKKKENYKHSMRLEGIGMKKLCVGVTIGFSEETMEKLEKTVKEMRGKPYTQECVDDLVKGLVSEMDFSVCSKLKLLDEESSDEEQ